MLIAQPKLVGIDSSVLGEWAKDAYSSEVSTCRKARDTLEALLASDWIPFLSFHQFEELACHANEHVVGDRMAFLRSLQLVSWAKSSRNSRELGSIVDLLRLEVDAVISVQESQTSEFRDRVRPSLVHFGDGREIETLEFWRELRPSLLSRQKRSRSIASIAHTTSGEDLTPKVFELIKMQALDDQSAKSVFRKQAVVLAKQLVERGDKRLQDTQSVASNFQDEVLKGFRNIQDSGFTQLEGFLQIFDVPYEEITERMNLDDFARVAQKRKRLRIVCGQSLDCLWPRLRKARIPSLWVQEELRLARQSALRASGSDLNDSYLAAFAPYLDAVIVDRRTNEYLKQRCRRSSAFQKSINQVICLSSYKSLVAMLQRGEV